MGIKKITAVIMSLSLILYTPAVTSCETTTDLYSMYDMSYTVEYPKDIMDTISKYQNAKKYVSMYQYVILSEYDTKLLDERERNCLKTIEKSEKSLLGCYNADLQTIYSYEDAYVTAVRQYDDVVKSKVTAPIDYEAPKPADVPTSSEYRKACNKKAYLDSCSNLGDVTDLHYPFNVACLIDSTDNNRITFLTQRDALVQSLFNGKVAKCDNTSLTIYHYNGVYTHYTGLSSVSVKKGDKVRQYEPVGTSTSKVTIQLKLNGKLVDISKLFKESE